MKKIIIIPDSFKGTMPAREVAAIMEEAVLSRYPGCDIRKIPFSDGGEGMVECLVDALGGEKILMKVSGPFGKETESFYGRYKDMAFVEMAAAAGLHLTCGEKNPAAAGTYGVGQLIKDAVEKGCRKIMIGLGGSCTNDAGAGMAAALGVKFIDDKGRQFVPVGGTLGKTAFIDTDECRRLLAGTEITALCDIDNPMYGPNGAAYVFAPQKGADSDTVKYLDGQLRMFAAAIEQNTGIKVSDVPGSGAAGAMGAGVLSLLGGNLKRGTETILEILGFEDMLTGCDCVITGEGSFDSQSFSGKAVMGIAKCAAGKSVPVVVVAGRNKSGRSELGEYGIIKIYETSSGCDDFEKIKNSCRDDLRASMCRMLDEISF